MNKFNKIQVFLIFIFLVVIVSLQPIAASEWNWESVSSSFGTSNIRSVAYGNGVWVAVGDQGKLATATDPTGPWTQRTSSFYTSNIFSVAYGNGVWVAVGASGKLATATDFSSLSNPADFLSPYKEYSWILDYEDSEYTVTDEYIYDFGYNQTNEFDGAETTLLTDQAINITDTNQSFDINYMPNNSDINSDLYSFVTIYKNEVELETLWSTTTFDVDWDTNLSISNPDYPYIITTQTAETTMTSASSTSGSYGYRILANIDTYIYTITKHSSATPTRAIIKTDAGEIIATASFVGNVATFDDPINIAEGTYYRIEADKEGSSYTYIRQNSTGGFPYANSEINFTGGSYNGGDTSYPYNIIQIETGQTKNKINKLITNNTYTWLFDWDNAGDNSNLDYTYTIGINTDNSLDGNETIKDENVEFTYSGLNQDANMFLEYTDWGEKYAYITIDIWYDGSVVKTQTEWTTETRTIDKYLDTSIVPDANESLIALNDYNYMVDFASEGYPDGHYIQYDWGITDDANIDTGTTKVFGSSVLLEDYDPSITEYILTEYLTLDYVGSDWYSYLTYYVYTEGGVLIDSNTFYSLDSYNIIAPYLLLTVYDENGLAGEGVKIKDETNNIEYETDTNSQFYAMITDLGWGDKYIQTTITHTDSSYNIGVLDYYWNSNYTYDINFMLHPSSDVRSHEFIVLTPTNEVWANKYIGFLESGSDSNITGIIQTDLEGRATINIEPDALLDVILYDENGDAIYTYENTIVTIKKPKDEITLADISPYDIYVGGLLNYNLVNQTDANITFSIFAGVTDYYTIRVADYNATIADRKYVPRNYLVKVEMGADYTDSYIVQPYLVSTTDAIIPTIKIIDLLGRSVPDVVVVISKFVGDSPEKKIIYSEKTDSTGTLSWSAQPLDKYYIDVYYNDVLQGSYIITPRTSADIYWINVDTSVFVVDPTKVMYDISWLVNDHLIQFENEIQLKAWIKSNTINSYDQIKVLAKQNNITQTEDIIDMEETPLNYYLTYTFDNDFFDGSVPSITYVVELYKDGELVKSFNTSVIWSKKMMKSGFFGALSQLPSDLGQPLSAILSIIMIVLFIAVLTMSGLPTNPTMISVIGLFGIGFFMFFGFFNTGVLVYGTDICWIAYTMLCIMSGYLGFREVSR